MPRPSVQRAGILVQRALPQHARRTARRLVPAALRLWYERKRTDVYLVSFPKCGRTWLRVMVGRVLQRRHGLPLDSGVVQLHRLAEVSADVPYIFATHEIPDGEWPARAAPNLARFRDHRVLLLVRDPRDVVVSLYHHRRERERSYAGTLSTFLDEPRGSFRLILDYYDAWVRHWDVPAEIGLVRYEDLHADPRAELRRVLDFIGVAGVADDLVSEAIEFASFGRMREMEETGRLETPSLQPATKGRYESYKTRRGEVGAYARELSPRDVARLNATMRRSLVGRFGYRAD